jgi:hypothetical protein
VEVCRYSISVYYAPAYTGHAGGRVDADSLMGVGAMVWGPEGAVAQFGGSAVMISGGSWRARCHALRRRLGRRR